MARSTPSLKFVPFLALVWLVSGCGGSGGPPANEPPTADAGPDLTVEERSRVTLSGRGADPDGRVVSLRWTQVSGPAVAIDDAASSDARFTAPDAASGSADLLFRLTVTDDRGGTASDDVTVTVEFFNTPPTADAGLDFVADERSRVTLSGRGEDSDGTIESYHWVQFFGPSVTLENPNRAETRFTAPDVTFVVSPLIFQLSVTDDLGATATDQVSVSLNVPPTADAGPDRIADEQVPISLTGRGSDRDGTIRSYQWLQIDGPPMVLEQTGATVNFTTPTVGAAATDLVFRLTVTDDKGSEASDEVTVTVAALVSVSGRVTYDYVPLVHGPGVRLDYGATEVRPVRGAVVQLMEDNRVVDTAITGDDGAYALDATRESEAFVRARAEIADGETPWDARVLDNTRDYALYALDGEPFRTGSSDVVADLHAASGWTGDGYGEDRAAAPFAILDTVHDAMQLVRSVDSGVDFEPLELLWSPNNRAREGRRSAYFIVPGQRSSGVAAIYLLGDEDHDTDEYDRSLIAHEWVHFFEATLSRSDSLGGGHGPGDQLDMRVAFSEGLANALSAMIVGEQSYAASFGPKQGSGWRWDIENAAQVRLRPGWFSEASVHEILYDLFDPPNDDGIELGFAPIHEVLVKDLPDTPTLTSIFAFIHALKTQVPEQAAAIDALVQAQTIERVVDEYGSTETNSGHPPSQDVLPVYGSLTVNGTAMNVCTTADFTRPGVSNDNRLGVRRFFRLSILQGQDAVAITATPVADESTEPDVCVYQRGRQAGVSEFAFPGIYRPDNPARCRERFSGNLSAGDYVLEVFDRRNAGPDPVGRLCFDVQVTSP